MSSKPSASLMLAACIIANCCPSPAGAEAAPFDKAVIEKAVRSIAVELRDGYVFPEKGDEAASAIEKSLEANAYGDVSEPALFAQRVTAELQAVTKDSHVRVIFGSPFGDKTPSTAPLDAGFEIKRLAGDVGYIRLPRFAPPDVFSVAADQAMRSVSDTTALIIDMQDNGGGHPASVAYFASFFLDPKRAVHVNSLVWRNRGTRTFRTETFWSSPTPVQYLHKSVYVLVGPKTYSAGEEFAYDLQVLKRATIVGARTRGGANPGGLKDVGSDLFVVAPSGRAENPITRGNWEGVGVIPDVQAAPEIAETTAVALALAEPNSASPK